MKSDQQRQSEYQTRQTQMGNARLCCWVSGPTKKTIGELAQQHGKTFGEVLDLGVAAAASLLSGHLQIVKQAQPARLIIQQQPPQRPVAPSELSANTDASPPPENATTAQQGKPEQAIADDADARIRAAGAAWIVEP